MSLKIISCNHPTSITNSVKKLIPAYIKPDEVLGSRRLYFERNGHWWTIGACNLPLNYEFLIACLWCFKLCPKNKKQSVWVQWNRHKNKSILINCRWLRKAFTSWAISTKNIASNDTTRTKLNCQRTHFDNQLFLNRRKFGLFLCDISWLLQFLEYI